MAESTRSDEPQEPERAEATEKDAAKDVEDLDVSDEEISERIRGGRRAISIPY